MGGRVIGCETARWGETENFWTIFAKPVRGKRRVLGEGGRIESQTLTPGLRKKVEKKLRNVWKGDAVRLCEDFIKGGGGKMRGDFLGQPLLFL